MSVPSIGQEGRSSSSSVRLNQTTWNFSTRLSRSRVRLTTRTQKDVFAGWRGPVLAHPSAGLAGRNGAPFRRVRRRSRTAHSAGTNHLARPTAQPAGHMPTRLSSVESNDVLASGPRLPLSAVPTTTTTRDGSTVTATRNDRDTKNQGQEPPPSGLPADDFQPHSRGEITHLPPTRPTPCRRTSLLFRLEPLCTALRLDATFHQPCLLQVSREPLVDDC